jgi:Tfp pilus assembly protein PilV
MRLKVSEDFHTLRIVEKLSPTGGENFRAHALLLQIAPPFSTMISRAKISQSLPRYLRARLRRGFTLLECMTAMLCFMIIALGVSAGVIQSQRLSQMNIMRNAAYNVAQGYMEQMLSINPADLEAASEPWVSNRPPIPTEAVNSLTTNSTAIEVSDPLYVSPMTTIPSGLNLTARTDITGDVWNNKSILVDLLNSTASGSNSTATYPVTMNERLDVTISRAWTQVNGVWQVPQSPSQPGYFLIRIDFQYQCPGYLSTTWQTGSIRMVRNDVAGP